MSVHAFTNFTGTNQSSKGSLTVVAQPSADTQVWTLIAQTGTTFSIQGSRSGSIGTLSVGTTLSTDDGVTFNITAGSQAFDVGDTFTISVRGDVMPRYVTKDVNGNVINFPGGPAADVDHVGTWLVPRRMFENLPRDLQTELTFGDILQHYRSIIMSQDGFIGSSFGINNYRFLTPNFQFGGFIREYSGNFPLLASNLIQRDMSPLTIIDFAEKQYSLALASVDTFLANELANFVASTNSMVMPAISTSDSNLVALLKYFEDLRSTTANKSVFADTTAGVTCWPITLPMMGAMPAVAPGFKLDLELSIQVLIHHDGHMTPLAGNNEQLDRTLALTVVDRSDGTKSGGMVSASAPSRPYKRQLWFDTTTKTLKVFDVVGDSLSAPTGSAGAFWFRRADQALFAWDGTAWAPSGISISSLWKTLDVATIRNSMLLAIEQKLYAAVHPATIVKFSGSTNAEDMEIELARFSAKYSYDTYAPDYDPANAFTWNYKTATGIARWYDLYNAHFNVAGSSLPTPCPNLEPWKLLNLATKPSTWDADYGDTTGTRLWTTAMWTYIQSQRVGLKLCVNTNTDELLPPYVNPSNPQSVNALMTSIPAGIDNVYVFGDNGPVELVWTKSLEYNYSVARAQFKSNPMNFLDALWGETYFTANAAQVRVERNLQRPLAPSMFLLHGEKQHIINDDRIAANHFVGGTRSLGDADIVSFVVSHVEDNQTYFSVLVNGIYQGSLTEGQPSSFTFGSVNFSNVTIDDLGIPFSLGDKFTYTNSQIVFTPESTKKLIGLGQIYTNLLRYNSIDTAVSEQLNAFRGWDVRLVHRIGALLRGDSLAISAAGIPTLPTTAYSLILKKATSTESKWISGLRVQLVSMGSRTLNANGNYVPMTDASDWIFRVETYNPQHPVVERYVLDSNGEYVTFNALDRSATKLAFKKYTAKLALENTTTPINITGLQPTLDFIWGYIARLEELGWQVNAGDRIVTDDETGRNLDWQLEVEKLVAHVYRGMLPGDGHILNPFMQGLWLSTPVGLMGQYSDKQFLDVDSIQAVYDVEGAPIPLSELQVIRTDDFAVTYSNRPIFSAHVFIDEFEHVILFNSHVSDETDSTTLFNPFSGLRISTANLSYVRQEEFDRKPRYNGFVLVGNDVKRNLVSSIDAIGHYYDPSKTFNEPKAAAHALALLGFNKKDYFDELGTSDSTQFNYWRGLVQSKGTNMTIDAFVNFKKFHEPGAEVDEYWAYKLAEYGDNRPREFPELKIEVADCLQYFTQLQFYNVQDSDYTPLPLFTQIENGDDSRWYMIDDLGKGVNFPADKIEAVLPGTGLGYYSLQDIFHNSDAVPQVYLRATTNGIVTDTPASSAYMVNASLVRVNAVLVPPSNTTYQYVVKGYTWRNFSKLSPIKLFDYKNSALIKEIALWHPAIGIHSYEALDIVNSITSTDPALYNTTTQTVDNPNYVFTKPWGKREVGRVWWDTRNLGYIPYYDATIFPDRNERNARWGNLADWASIDIYEWVESSVAPNEYDALASAQEGQSDINPAIKASGSAALKSYYSRDRVISIRPVAWSKAGVSNAFAHPSFPSSSVKVFAASSALFTDAGRTSDAGLLQDRRFAAWKNNKPYGETIIGSDLVYDIGSSVTMKTPQIVPSGFITSMSVTPIPNGRLGVSIGRISLTTRVVQLNTATYNQMLRMSDATGYQEDVVVDDWLAGSEDELTLQFKDFGLQITITRNSTTALIGAADIALDISTSWMDVYVREGVRHSTLVPLPATTFVEDETDVDYSNFDYGWKAWDVPTQSDLDSDMVFPRNSWLPYLGDQTVVDASPSVISEMKADTLTLKNSIPVKRYATSWTDWVPLKDVRIGKISNGTDAISFARAEFISATEEMDRTRISIYANGLQVSPKNYVIQGDAGQENIQILSTLAEGTNVLFIYRAKVPTAAELSFDSSVKDDPSVQTEFKAAYQYTKVDTRSENGAISGAKYYFWVQNSSVVRPGKSTSLVQATSVLKAGPSQFAAFAKIDERKDAFDSCVIAGLNTYVTNNDTYKLRFIHCEALRDDPEEMALRNVHTEWALLKKSQNSKIPASLWAHLTDAAAGEDLTGNPLPSPTRVDYDARNGTRSSFGFGSGQILADTELVRETIRNTILNTTLTIRIGTSFIPDTITSLDFNQADEWFKDAASARATMDLIWSSSRARQINEIFFAVLEDALANNYEFTDIFKTSLISVHSVSAITGKSVSELTDEQF